MLINLNPKMLSTVLNIIILGTVKSGTGRMNAIINITNQKFLPLNVYLDNAKPVVADTNV